MKTRRLLLFLILFSAIGLVSQVKSQVTVGSGSLPEAAALLQIKDQQAANIGGATATKGGLLLPRVDLVKRMELLPFFKAGDLGTPNYEDVQKPAHKGLMVYNLSTVPDEGLTVGIYSWDGSEWKGLYEAAPQSKISITSNCDSITFSGQYTSGVALGAGHYMSLPIYIEKPGAYSITAIPNPDNGYYFQSKGDFLTTGYNVVMIPAAGTPTKASTAPGNAITLTINGEVITSCPKYLEIQDGAIKPDYRMTCSSVAVKGLYFPDQDLTSSNYIELTLSVDASSLGAKYIIETNTVEGIYFKGEGLLSTTSQTVRLMGYGKPANTNPKVMTISSNSTKTGTTCSATVRVTIPKKKILALGGGIYNIASTGSGPNVMMLGQNAFGTLPTSKVQVEGFEFLGGTGVNSTNLASYIAQNPDIIVMGFDLYITAAEATLYANYLAKGGVILAFNEGNGNAASNLMKAVFNNASITQSRINAAGTVYALPSLVEDEVLNGPFGDIRGLQWGEDASQTCAVQNVPASDIEVYSTGNDISTPTTNAGVTAFKHKTLNFIFFGDGGFFSYPNSTTNADYLAYPFMLNTNKLPVPKASFGRGTRFPIYNSTIFANALAWALKKAEFEGINTK